MSVLVFHFVKQHFCGSILLWMQLNKLTSASFSCVCLGFDHEFRHSIVKVTVDRWVDLETTSMMLCGNPLSITEKTHGKLASVSFFYGSRVVKLSTLTRWRIAYIKKLLKLCTNAKIIFFRNGNPEKCDHTHKPSRLVKESNFLWNHKGETFR